MPETNIRGLQFMPDSLLTAPATYSAKDIAALLKCSTRHVWRLRDAGLLPQPTKLGALVRWPAARIDEWVSRGCPPGRKGGR